MTLLESAMSGAKGFEICYGTEIREDAMLFGESQSRVVVSIDSKNKENFEKLLTAHQLYFSLIGKVTKDSIQIKSENWGAVSEWATLYNTAIEKEIFA